MQPKIVIKFNKKNHKFAWKNVLDRFYTHNMFYELEQRFSKNLFGPLVDKALYHYNFFNFIIYNHK